MREISPKQYICILLPILAAKNSKFILIISYNLFLDFLPASKIQKILPLLKSHLAGDEMNLTTMLLELTAEICKSGVIHLVSTFVVHNMIQV